MVKYIYILFIVLFFNSCFPKKFNQRHFKLNHDIEIQEIKTNGYYYSIFDYKGDYSKYTGKGIDMYILLNNSYFHNFQKGFGDECGDSIDLECDILISESMLDSYLNYKDEYKKKSKVRLWNWGKYEIKNDTILIQWYYNRFGDYYLVEEEGFILDSTSFRLFRTKDYRNNEENVIDRHYQFKQYDIEKLYNKIPENL